jgi:Cdc6-like AAA superfamily ATPase
MEKSIKRIRIYKGLEIQKLDNQVNNSLDAIPSGNIIYAIIGGKGSGKSTLILNLLKKKNSPFYKSFDNIFFCSPTAKRDHKFDKLVEELEEEEKYFTDCNNETLNEIIERLKESVDEDEGIRNLLILDDCIHMLSSSTEKNSALNEIITQSRHMKLSVIIVSQQLKKINTLIRNQIDCISFFRTHKIKEYQALEELLNINKKILKIFYDQATKTNNGFLHISLMTNTPVFFRNFDKMEVIN